LKQFSLFELNTYLRRVIALNFENPVWVQAEILQAKSSKGHIYLELVQKEKEEDAIKAKASAVIWTRQFQKINQQLKGELPKYLQTGSEVSFLAEVTYHEVYGLKLSIQAIDPGYTLGQMEKQKLATIDKLRAEQLLERNRLLPLPQVIQRIAVISSNDAAGFHDFQTQLSNNPYDYKFQIHLYPNAVQGKKVVHDFLNNMSKIAMKTGAFDCVVIIRGGGSKLDLSRFDQYEVCREIGICKIPVFTGIGHETDQVVADLAAYQDFKTPTAVASYIITHVLHFETLLSEKVDRIEKKALDLLSLYKSLLEARRSQLDTSNVLYLRDKQNQLSSLKKELNACTRQRISFEKLRLNSLEERVKLLDPQKLHERGYSMVTFDGKRPITSVDEVPLKSKILTLLKDGILTSTVQSIESAKDKRLNS
jgi:exodeoxyribonuclease VII large subunit